MAGVTLDIKVQSPWIGLAGRAKPAFSRSLRKQLAKRGSQAKQELTDALRVMYDGVARNPIVSGRMRASLGAKLQAPTGEMESEWLSWGYFPDDIAEIGGSPVIGRPSGSVKNYIALREHGGAVRRPSVAAIQFWAARIGLDASRANAYRIANYIGRKGAQEGLHVLPKFSRGGAYKSIVQKAISGTAVTAVRDLVSGAGKGSTARSVSGISSSGGVGFTSRIG